MDIWVSVSPHVGCLNGCIVRRLEAPCSRQSSAVIHPLQTYTDMEFLEVMLMFLMILLFFLCQDTGKIPEYCSDWENETHSSSEEDGSEADDTESYEEENETKVLCLSAGAGNVVVVEDESFLPPVQLSPGGPWVSFKDPRKSCLPHFHGRAHLNKAAKFKHIDPTCRSEEDAEKKSVERNSRYRQKTGSTILCSRSIQMTSYWSPMQQLETCSNQRRQ